VKLSKLFGALLTPLFVALMACSAHAALPNELPTGATFNITGGATELGSGITAIKSSATKGSGASTGEKTGTFTLVLEKVKNQLGSTCTGLSDTTSGNVTTTGTTELRWDTTLTKVLLLFKLNEMHASCGLILMKEKGCVAGQVLATSNTLVKEFAVDLVVEKADNTPIVVENAADNGTENCELKLEVNDEQAALASEKAVYTFKDFAKGLGAGKNEVEIMTK
jgi:hypothetical protein